jgi:hypothetical protein
MLIRVQRRVTDIVRTNPGRRRTTSKTRVIFPRGVNLSTGTRTSCLIVEKVEFMLLKVE